MHSIHFEKEYVGVMDLNISFYYQYFLLVFIDKHYTSKRLANISMPDCNQILMIYRYELFLFFVNASVVQSRLKIKKR